MRLHLGLIALLVTGCPSEKKKAPEAPPPPEVELWTWFAFEEAQLAEAARGPSQLAVVTNITQHLKAVSPGIAAEVAIGAPGKPHTLVLTANGDTTLFPAVRSLAASAPATLKHWKVVPFRQRRESPPTIKLGALTVQPEDFLFKELGRTEGKLDIEIRVKGLTPETEKTFQQAVFLLLDHVIGEYDTETKLNAIRIEPMAVATDAALKPLAALAPLVDSLPAPDAG